MPCQCIVPKCRTSPKKMKLHLAPYTKPIFKTWKALCPFLNTIEPRRWQHMRFCGLHFRPEYINELNRLTPDAIPTLRLPNPNYKPRYDWSVAAGSEAKDGANTVSCEIYYLIFIHYG